MRSAVTTELRLIASSSLRARAAADARHGAVRYAVARSAASGNQETSREPRSVLFDEDELLS